MTRFDLREWTASDPISLSPGQRMALERITEGKVGVSSGPTVGTYVLRPTSWIGAFHVDELDFIIHPKLPLQNLLYLISYAIGRGRWSDEDARFISAPSLVEAVIPGFVHQVQRALRFGLLHGYRSVDEVLFTVRGRVRFEDQIRQRFGRFPPAEVRYDEFTADVEENRLLRAACDRLSRLRLRSRDSIQRLHAIRSALADIPVKEYHRGFLPVIHYTRLNEHYRPAVELARLILRNSAFVHQHGTVRASAFLIDMNQVFEDFVVVALREELRLSDQTFPQQVHGRLVLDRGHSIKLEPDMSWWDAGRCTFVGDVKYKHADERGIPNADLYQLLAYTIAARVPAGLLVYGGDAGAGGIRDIDFAGKQLVVSVLALDRAPEAIQQQIRTLAGSVRELRTRALSVPSPGAR